MHQRTLGDSDLDVSAIALGSWLTEAETERGNDDALAAVVAHKRHGRGDPGEQLVTLTLRDLAALITGTRPGEAGSATGTSRHPRRRPRP